MNSPNSSERMEKIIRVDKKFRLYKHMLTPNNLLQSGLWKEQGTLSVELLFVRKVISCIFLEGIDLLIPLFDSKRRLAKVLLEQPEKMVSIEEAIKRIKDRAKKKKRPQPTTSAGSPLSSPPRRAEKRKEVGPIAEQQKEKRIRETIDIDVEPISINIPPKTSLWKNPKYFAPVCPQLVFEEDKPIYEKVGEVGVLERTA